MIDSQRLIRLLADLVRHNSVNPDLVPGAPGEEAIAAFLCQYCRSAGLEAEVRQVGPRRASVLARLRGRGERPPLLLNGHLDTVGVEGMTVDPFEPVIREGRLYGRGAFDMKGGVAAMVEAALAAAAAGPPPGDVVLAMVADEEYASRGTEAVVREVTAGAAVVTEPTALEVCIAHKGFAWITIETAGRAAHGSRHDEGVDAIVRMGRVLAALERLEREHYPRRRHPLLGRPSVHASLITGGQGLSTYPERCRLQVERRTLPAERPEDVTAEVEGLLAELRRADPSFEATWSLSLFRPGLESPPQAPLVGALRRAARSVLGREPALVGASPWMDSALLAAAGIPTVIFGPAGSGAHAAEEWVDLASVAATAEVLARFVVSWAEEG
ncbi:MAG: ArgE/DapE family deacylase [Armatimonadota bacterium]|nr:ArgE/DapE family deacylase [Armatimonadota bacterium]MDR7427754.1 ArgE/DapE family deacylase [Armatimonadota bacterium]MDR7464225.1 ArgE/DapE family deacylase [Armatimonadota bacterium]MDR7469364.1 ArgE/DapE family deacylase [Armatimonadota bacterium]MDR7475918.1 ArgE/DapE family deacylase [Armatimonadota bacterium]